MYVNFRNINWNEPQGVLITVSAVLVGAILAFTMEVTEFMVVTHTSSLTLSISGVLKVKLLNGIFASKMLLR